MIWPAPLRRDGCTFSKKKKKTLCFWRSILLYRRYRSWLHRSLAPFVIRNAVPSPRNWSKFSRKYRIYYWHFSLAGFSSKKKKTVAIQTEIYTGAFVDDVKLVTVRDMEILPKHAATRVALSPLANRISWFFFYFFFEFFERT